MMNYFKNKSVSKIIRLIGCIGLISLSGIIVICAATSNAVDAPADEIYENLIILGRAKPAEPIESVEIVEVIEPEVVDEPSYTEDDLFCLAVLIYQEGGGDHVCNRCRYRIGDVVLNRVDDERFPNTIREVITQKRQYGLLHYTGVKWADRASEEYEQHAVQRAWDTAKALLEGHHSDLYGNGYIFQAEFEQGTDSIYCCGHYFAK